MINNFENRAIILVKQHLFNKLDLGGDRLSNHCIRVGAMAACWCLNNHHPHEALISGEIATLHDILEDSVLCQADLIQLGYSEYHLICIDLLTHKPHLTYDEYMTNLCNSGKIAAILAKLCDNQDNQCQWRWGVSDKTTEHAQKLINRYQQWEPKLLRSLDALTCNY